MNMGNQSILSEEQLEQRQRLRAFNYAMHRADLISLSPAEHLRKEVDYKLCVRNHQLNPMRLCFRCDDFL